MDAIMSLNQVSEDTPQEQPKNHQANASTNTESVVQLVQMVKKLNDQINKMSNNIKQSSKDINSKTGKPWRRYCHTHGCTRVGTAKIKDKIIKMRQRFKTEWKEVTLIVYQSMNNDWEERER